MRTLKPRGRATGTTFRHETPCPYCGERGSHYVPASCGEDPFLICGGERKPVPQLVGYKGRTIASWGVWRGADGVIREFNFDPSIKETK